MRIVAEMEVRYGDYDVGNYSVRVTRRAGQVIVNFKSKEKNALSKGGSLQLPAAIAGRVGHALVLASSGELSGPLGFDVREDSE